jgi:hypothetical protein
MCVCYTVIECTAHCDLIGGSQQPAASSHLQCGGRLSDFACCAAGVGRGKIVTFQISAVEMDA